MKCPNCHSVIDPNTAWKSSATSFYCSEFCADIEVQDASSSRVSKDEIDRQYIERLQRLPTLCSPPRHRFAARFRFCGDRLSPYRRFFAPSAKGIQPAARVFSATPALRLRIALEQPRCVHRALRLRWERSPGPSISRVGKKTERESRRRRARRLRGGTYRGSG